MRSLLPLLVAVPVLLLLTACSRSRCCGPVMSCCGTVVVENAGSPDGAVETAETADTAEVAEAKPEPKPAKPLEGAESPEALIARMKQLDESDDLSPIVPLVLPEQRGILSFVFGMFAPIMAITMGEAMAEMAGGGDPAEVEKTKAKIAKTKKDFEALLKKHGIEMDMSNPTGGLEAMGDDPAAAMTAMNELFAGVDHAAFIRDASAFMKSQGEDGEAGGMSMGPSKDQFKLEDVKIEVDGDKAVATAPSQDDPLHMVKRDGRWYIDFTAMMGEK